MLTYVLLAALADDYLPREYGGIYISPSGQPAIIDAGTYIDNPMILFNFPTRYVNASRIRKVPAGSYYGEYASNRKLALDDSLEARRGYMGTRESGENSRYFLYGVLPIGPDAPKAVGTASLAFEGAGRSTLARIKLTDKFGSLLINDGFQYVGGGSVIQMGGSYASPKMKLTLTEGESGVRRTWDGSLEYSGKKYMIVGGRIYGRGAFNLQDPATGNAVGYGWLTWQPTASRAIQILGGTPKATDRIIGMVTITGTSYREAEMTFTETP